MRLRSLLIVVMGSMLVSASSLAAPRPIEVPDLTKSTQVDTERTYNLGATGMRGWIFTKAPTNLDAQQGRTTVLARQILVTHVGAKSPADGVMRVGDVIVGVDAKPFDDDARKRIAAAIQRAETNAAKGDLNLLVWREGKTQDIRLKLRVMGEYDVQNPLASAKAKLIFEEACRALAKEGIADDWAGPVSGLAMLASGRDEFMPTVREYAHKVANKTTSDDPQNPERSTWTLSYRALFLCEYYLITRDDAVLPAIRQLTLSLALGQSMFGTYGHAVLRPGPNGELYGSVPAYGPVNNCGLTAIAAIAMGLRCGIDEPEVRPAIERGAKFFKIFVDRGSVPYGEHVAFMTHENNGKNAMAAFFYSMLPDRVEEARFYAKMSAASYANREYGHTGQGFGYLWAALGANIGGPAALAAYFNEVSWHYDLVRRNDGSFTYDGGEQYGAGSTDDSTYYGKSSYNGLSPNATYVLAYSTPLRKLFLTGREGGEMTGRSAPAYWLSETDVKAAIASGRFDLDRKNRNAEQLVAALGDWSPVAREWAAEELATRPEAGSLVPRLMEIAEGNDVRQRLGACDTLGRIRDTRALPLLIKLLKHSDSHVRFKAAEALERMGDDARPALTQLLQALIDSAAQGNDIDWSDPVQFAQSQLGTTVFGGLLRGSIEGVDINLLMPAIRSTLHNADGRGRANVARVLRDQLTVDQVRMLGPDILAAIREIAPANTMFGNEIREAGLDVLAKHRFEEGLDAGLLFARTQSMHGSQDRMARIMKNIASYGTHAKRLLPELHKLADECRTQPDFPQWARDKKVQAVLDGIKAVEATTETPTLLRLKDVGSAKH